MTNAAEKVALGQLSQLLPQVVALIHSLLSSAENQEILLFLFIFFFEGTGAAGAAADC
jgi:hypothetical protein